MTGKLGGFSAAGGFCSGAYSLSSTETYSRSISLPPSLFCRKKQADDVLEQNSRSIIFLLRTAMRKRNMDLQVYLRERCRLESAGLCEGGRFRRAEQNRGGHWDEQVNVVNYVLHHLLATIMLIEMRVPFMHGSPSLRSGFSSSFSVLKTSTGTFYGALNS
jgi:hypothetical protein